VYDSNCASCHGASPASLNTPPDEVPPLLRSGKLRAHRFSLEDGDMQALFEYLKESGK
jgi:mono/diheme cytochrome c family protein